MKYKLVNNQTKEEQLCDRIRIDGFDYYVDDMIIKENDWYIAWETINGINSNYIIQKATASEPVDMYSWASNYKKVIATSNPNIDIPKVVDEVKDMAEKLDFKPYSWMRGYNKSQEAHPFSEEDMIEFKNFCIGQEFDINGYNPKDTKELLKLWKEQKPKIVYYEDL